MSAATVEKLFGANGLVAVVTGGGTALAENGAAKVYIVGRRRDKLEEVANSKPGVIIPVEGDVTSKESLEAIAIKIKEEIGYVNVVIANSGHSGPSMQGLTAEPTVADIQKHIMSQPMEDFTQTFAVNVTGVLYTGIAFLELLDAGNKNGNMPSTVRSQMIFTSSIGGYNKTPGMGFAYNTSKAAVTHLTKMLASYLGPHKIRVNALAPGLFPSDISARLMEGKDATREGAFPTSFIPNQKAGDEEDMGGTILYMVSRAGAYLNGSIVLIDGGRCGVLNTSY